MTLEMLEIARPVRRLTVAIGLFDGPLAVRSALRDLANYGFGIDRIKVFAGLDAIGYAQLSGDLAVGTATGAGAFHRVEVDCHSDAIACIRDIVRQTLAANGGNAHETLTIWGLERQANSLQQHLTDGGSVLIVRIDSTEEQRSVCSMLLHYANRGVQTHQLRYGRPAAGPTAGVVGHSLTS